MLKPAAIGLTLGLILIPGTCLANDLLAVEQFSGQTVSFQLQRAYANLTLRVTGPNEYHASAVFAGGNPSLDLTRYGAASDGPYNYHLVGTTGEAIPGSNRPDGRPAKTDTSYVLKSVSKSGSFTIKGGAIVSRNATETKRDR